ncbi:MAG: DUF2339 domain-containing protein [Pseudomonadota bacterium]
MSFFWFCVLMFCAYILYVRLSKRSNVRIEMLERQVAALQLKVNKLLENGSDSPEAAARQAWSGPAVSGAPDPLAAQPSPPAAATIAPAMAAPTTTPATRTSAAVAIKPAPAVVPEAAEKAPVAAAAAEAAPPRPRPAAPSKALPPPRPAWLTAIMTWMFTGNLVAKIGLLILFIGVSFLLKYAAQRVTIPIEVRLTGIVLADIALLLWGWRIRLSRRDISLPVQGAALGILMLVTFGAFRLYDLIPAGLAFGLLFVLTAFTCVLAVLQNALWLAVFGIVGGFLSPILTSTGSGSHIALFSYYALLNTGILAIALRRTWNSLNLLGFAFTFVIGTAWGVLKYSPDVHYLSTQLFLVLFFLFYVAIAIVYAVRQSVDLKHYVNATIVFGTPLLAFALQLGLMRGKEFGNAFSALGFGVFYTALALAMWRRRGPQLGMLVESFLALGVVFGTLALPFALDGRWTSAAWALEGAGVVWIGLRQRQKLTWMFGLLVQAGAWISFIGAISGLDQQAALESNLWLGFIMLAVTAFLMATRFRGHSDDEGAIMYGGMAALFLGFAAFWLMAGAWTEIFLRVRGVDQTTLLAASGLGTAALLALIAARMRWQLAGSFALVAQAVAGVTLLVLAVAQWNWTEATPNMFDKPLLGALMIAIGALVSSWNLSRIPDTANRYRATALALLIWGAFWWFGPVLNAVSGALALAVHTVARFGALPEWLPMYQLCLVASALGFVALARRLAWPALHWLGISVPLALVWATLGGLWQLYLRGDLPMGIAWIAFGALWLANEFLMQFFPRNGLRIADQWLKLLHFTRTAGPWLMLWKVGEIAITRWLRGNDAEQAMLSESGWNVAASWANFVPAWAMMLVVIWVARQSRSEQWPTLPLARWYRRAMIPAATLWSLVLVALFNIGQDGTMQPLPYLPLLNPLDLSTGFALLLGAVCYRTLRVDTDNIASGAAGFTRAMPFIGGVLAYLWFNLVLLRSAAQYLPLPYRYADLFGSQFVQAMLSLVWSITALILMRRAAAKMLRRDWLIGASLLGLVVGKLFLVDLSNIGSVARIVSFVGVGLLMVLIGYLAPYPTQSEQKASKEYA